MEDNKVIRKDFKTKSIPAQEYINDLVSYIQLQDNVIIKLEIKIKEMKHQIDCKDNFATIEEIKSKAKDSRIEELKNMLKVTREANFQTERDNTDMRLRNQQLSDEIKFLTNRGFIKLVAICVLTASTLVFGLKLLFS